MKPAGFVAALLSVVLVAGCSEDGDSTPGKTAMELQVTMSSANGLYFSPHLLVLRGSIDDVISAVETAELVGQTPSVHPSSDTQAQIRTDAITTYGVGAYGKLAVLFRVGAARVLRVEDVAVLQQRRQVDGSYAPDSGSPGGLNDRVQATASALTALRALNRLDEADVEVSRAWLRSVAATASDRTTVFTALQAIRETGPSGVTTFNGSVPSLAQAQAASPTQRTVLLNDTAAYVKAVGISVAIKTVDHDAAVGLYNQNVGSSDFPTLLNLVTVMRATGASGTDLGAVTKRLDEARLPDGLYRNTAEDYGSAIATVYALRLMRMRGDGTKSRELANNLTRYADLPQVRSHPQERLIAVGASVVAGRKEASAQTSSLCEKSVVVPDVVTESNLVGWAEMTQICAEAGTPSPNPQVRRWPATSVRQIVDQATLVNALVATGRQKEIPSWVDKGAMQRLLQGPVGRTTLMQASTIGSALLTLTDGDGRELLDGLRMRAAKARGCPGLPSLYTTGGTDVSCDLRTTIAVERFLSA